MEILQIKKLNDLAIIPTKGSPEAAGYDLSSLEEYILAPMERKLFKTGLSIAIPRGMYGRIAPRSGLAFKDGIDVMAGCIDSDYRGEINVLLINLSTTEKQFKVGDKIAQIIFENYNDVECVMVNELTETIRGAGGFGSTDNTTIPITNRNISQNKSPIKNYESKTDILEQWKKINEISEIPVNYESLIKEREKNLK